MPQQLIISYVLILYLTNFFLFNIFLKPAPAVYLFTAYAVLSTQAAVGVFFTYYSTYYRTLKGYQGEFISECSFQVY